jgi:isopentenyl-diphosphate delta-isomerase
MTRPRKEILSSPDELFDLVDRDDRTIGQAPRREVHAKHLLHRATHVMVYNAAGQLFLQRRAMTKDTFPGCWDSSCSGHVDAGEDYPEAARRELGEEIGLEDESLPLRPVVKLGASPETGHEFIQIYLLGPYAGPFTLNAEEIIEGKWVTPAALDALIRDHPQQVAGALRLLWSRHRAEIVAAIE